MSPRPFQAGPVALVRAVAQQAVSVPPLPDLDDRGNPTFIPTLVAWLRAVRQDATLFEAIENASPSLANALTQLSCAAVPDARRVRRTAVSAARYLLRLQGRATPFGLFAGVTVVDFARSAQVDWRGNHTVVTRASSEWLHQLAQQWEGRPDLLAHLRATANTTLSIRGDQLVVPYQPHHRGDSVSATDVSLNYTAAVRAALDSAANPVRIGEVEKAVAAAFPAASERQTSGLVTELVRRGALVTALRAPSTEPDALAHLLTELDAACADCAPQTAAQIRELRQIHAELERGSEQPTHKVPQRHAQVVERIREITPGLRSHPLALDVRLDATLALPTSVARDTERVAVLLTQLSPAPFGTTPWKDYHQRFYERYGIGSLVPVLDVVGDHGIGFPAGYPGATLPERPRAASPRDEALAAVAQAAALDGRQNIELTDELLARLGPEPDPMRVPPHLEVGVRVHTANLATLNRGEYLLEVVSASRGAGVRAGRFLPVLASDDAARLSDWLRDLPGSDEDTITAQLSFPPLDPNTAHVTRAPQVLPTLISLDEHRAPAEGVLTLADLAVGCDGRRLYLAAPGLGKRVEAVGFHALSLKLHTPPLARFLIELGRAQCAAVTVFDWGTARTMPFLPRLTSGRTIVSPARWRLNKADLPAARDGWEEAFAELRDRRRLPARVYLTEGDRQLPLDLDQAAHRVLLRIQLAEQGYLVLSERLAGFGWLGDREHEVTIPLRRTHPSPWPPLPQPTTARVLTRTAGQPPRATMTVLASLYGDVRRQDAVLCGYLPELLTRLDHPRWWFARYRDPEPCLRVRVEIPHRIQRGPATEIITAWGEELHRAGLLREIRYSDSYPETGRWGGDRAWDAAESVFRADSRAVLAQLRQRPRPDRRVLFAVNSLAIASAFLGDSHTGASWLVEHLPSRTPAPTPPRTQLKEAVRLADPRDAWSTLRSAPGGAAITTTWETRHRALAAYRACFPGPGTEGVDLHDVLTSLLHVHFVRANAIDFDEEAICQHLARAAALTFLRRNA